MNKIDFKIGIILDKIIKLNESNPSKYKSIIDRDLINHIVNSNCLYFRDSSMFYNLISLDNMFNVDKQYCYIKGKLVFLEFHSFKIYYKRGVKYVLDPNTVFLSRIEFVNCDLSSISKLCFGI